MLARLDSSDRVEASYLARSGRQILIHGVAGATRGDLVAACQGALLGSTIRATPRAQAEADRAWAARASDDWLPGPELWKLSWREAEAFADRLLRKVLRPEVGGPVDRLRSILVESFFEGVRPKDGSGPVSKRWPKGAQVVARRAVLLKAAAEHLTDAQVEALRAVLADGERVRAAVRTP